MLSLFEGRTLAWIDQKVDRGPGGTPL